MIPLPARCGGACLSMRLFPAEPNGKGSVYQSCVHCVMPHNPARALSRVLQAGLFGLTLLGSALAATTQPFVMLPQNIEKQQTKRSSVQKDARGNLHAVYSTLDGDVRYATCKGACTSEGAWKSERITWTPNLPPDGFVVPKLRVAPDGSLHLGLYVNTSGLMTEQGKVYYVRCTSGCLKEPNWKLVDVTTRYYKLAPPLDSEWFTLDPQGRPRLAFVDNIGADLSDRIGAPNAKALWIGCDRACTTAPAWKTAVLDLPPLGGSGATTLTYDARGVAHLLAYFRTPDEANTELFYFQCAQNCQEARNWSQRIALASDLYSPDIARSWSVSVTPQGALYVPVYLGSTLTRKGREELVLLSCTRNCTTRSGWQRVSLRQAAGIPASVLSFGAGVDSELVGNKLILSFTARLRTQPAATEVMKLTCQGDCGAKTARWTRSTAASTTTFKLPNRGNCLFVGTGVEPHTDVTSDGRVTFTIAPTWGCKGTDYIVYRGGNPEYRSYSDMKWLNYVVISR